MIEATNANAGLDMIVDPTRAEAALWRRLRFEDDQPCRERLFNRYLTFARGIAISLFGLRRHVGLDRGDFEQFAHEGLLQALDRFDPLRGVPFAAFARRRIEGNVRTGMTTLSEIDAQLSYCRRVRRQRVDTLAAPAPAPAPDALTALAELSANLAIGLMLDQSHLALDNADPARDPYETLAWRQTKADLASALDDLPVNEATVIRQHYGNGLAFVQVAKLLNVTAGRISQLHLAALERLRRRIALKGYRA